MAVDLYAGYNLFDIPAIPSYYSLVARPPSSSRDAMHEFGVSPQGDKDPAAFLQFGQGKKKSSKAVVADIAADLKKKFRYKIFGELDLLFEGVAKAVPEKDQFAFTSLKKDRMSVLSQLKAIEEDTVLTEAEKQEASARAQVSFVELAVRKLYPLRTTEGISPKALTHAAAVVVTELKDIATDFAASKGGSVTAPEDIAFLDKISGLQDKLEEIIKSQKLLLRQKENVLFSAEGHNAQQALAEIGVIIDIEA